MFRLFKQLIPGGRWLVLAMILLALPGWTQTSGITSDIFSTQEIDAFARIKPVARGNDADGYGRWYHFIVQSADTDVETMPIGVRGWDALSVAIITEVSAVSGPVRLVTPDQSLSANIELRGNLYPGGTPTVTSGLKTWGISDASPTVSITDGNGSWYAPIGISKSPISKQTIIANANIVVVTNSSDIYAAYAAYPEPVTSVISNPGIYQYDVHGLDRVLFAVSGNSATQHIFLRVNTAPGALRGEN